MASYTSNLNLKKPSGSENVAIGDINNNMDLIDSAYGDLEDMFGGLKFIKVSNGFTTGNVKITFAAGTSHAILFIHGNGTAFNMYYVTVYSTGTASAVTDLFNRLSNISVTADDNVITIANNGGSNTRVDCILLNGSITGVS